MSVIPKEFIKTSSGKYTYQVHNLWRIYKFPFSHWKVEMVGKTYIRFNAKTLKEIKQKVLDYESSMLNNK